MSCKRFFSISMSFVFLFVLVTGAVPALAGGSTPISPSSLPAGLEQIVRETLASPDWQFTASDGAGGDYFGRSVALSGDTALVGAWNDDIGANTDQGSVYVFLRSGTAWTQQAKLTASDGMANDYFGISVSLAGNTALVGAYGDDIGTNDMQGSAYVFVRNGTTWTQQKKLTASDGASNDKLGYSVALSVDTALVGAYQDDVGANSNQGSAYIFTRSGTSWTSQAKLTASDGAAGDWFGFSVALDGDTALVGAPDDSILSNSAQGSAYIFTRSGTSWTQQQKLTASDGATDDNFGVSVAFSGDTALVGAYKDDIGAYTDQGSAYVFVRSGTSWTQQQKLTDSGGVTGDEFGFSVALSGNWALVGAPHCNVHSGEAFLFGRSGTTWTLDYETGAPDGATGDYFGISVALWGNATLVGAPDDDVGANANQGSAYFTAPMWFVYLPFSQGVYDGWVRESSETSGVGGTMNNTATLFYLGDDAQDRQFRAILSFDTSVLPDDTVIIDVILRIRKQGLVGTDPFTTHGGLVVDIRTGSFSNTRALQLTDFQREADKVAAGVFPKTPVDGWYSKRFSSATYPYINLVGFTQFRLRFQKDDNDDMSADYLKLYSGDAGEEYRPLLIIAFYAPSMEP